jgi:hypothetical protein
MRTRKTLRRKGTKQSFSNEYVREFLAARREDRAPRAPEEVARSGAGVELLSPAQVPGGRPPGEA